VLRVYASYDVYLGDILASELKCACLNLVERHIPRIGIALTAAERAELAVKDADVRWLQVYVTVVKYTLATCLALALCGKLS
jgi:hypothetical protein